MVTQLLPLCKAIGSTILFSAFFSPILSNNKSTAASAICSIGWRMMVVSVKCSPHRFGPVKSDNLQIFRNFISLLPVRHDKRYLTPWRRHLQKIPSNGSDSLNKFSMTTYVLSFSDKEKEISIVCGSSPLLSFGLRRHF